MIFGCSVNDLLQTDERPSIQSVLRYPANDVLSGYWGNFGVRLAGGLHTRWYPITESEYARISNCLGISGENDWITVETLNNRVLFVNTKNVVRIQLIDDDLDSPEDWSHVDQGLVVQHDCIEG